MCAVHPTGPHAERCRVLAGLLSAFTKAVASLGVKSGYAGQGHIQLFRLFTLHFDGQRETF